jgi:hypothetical protein
MVPHSSGDPWEGADLGRVEIIHRAGLGRTP